MKSSLISLSLLLLWQLCLGQQLEIESGAQMVLQGNVQLVLDDLSLKQDGTFESGQSTLVLEGDGPASTSTLAGSGALKLYRLTLNKSLNLSQLDADIVIVDQLRMQQSSLDLQGHEIDLGSSGYLTNENETRRVFSSLPSGEVVRMETYTGPAAADSGNLGLLLTSAANLGQTEIRRGHFPPSFPGGSGIERYFDISPANNTGLNATLRMTYFDQELNGLPEGDLLMFKSTDGGNSWNPEGFSTRNAAQNYIEVSGVDGFSIWTAATFATFPVEWLGFEAKPLRQQVQCSWLTASEEAVSHFEVERSTDGNSFEKFAEVAAAGYSQEIQSYQAIDPAPRFGTNIYRVKAVDQDGSERYSDMVSLWWESRASATLFPNPTQGEATLAFTSELDAEVRLQLYTISGKLLWEGQASAFAGRTEIPLSLTSYPEGVYLLEVRSRVGNFRSKIA
ncbi:MAG: T9SS type A sorting domain-containing protein, partial [Bacteroidota bacterium]